MGLSHGNSTLSTLDLFYAFVAVRTPARWNKKNQRVRPSESKETDSKCCQHQLLGTMSLGVQHTSDAFQKSWNLVWDTSKISMPSGWCVCFWYTPLPQVALKNIKRWPWLDWERSVWWQLGCRRSVARNFVGARFNHVPLWLCCNVSYKNIWFIWWSNTERAFQTDCKNCESVEILRNHRSYGPGSPSDFKRSAGAIRCGICFTLTYCKYIATWWCCICGLWLPSSVESFCG